MQIDFYSAQDGHHVPLIAPQNVSGGKTSPAFALKNYAHASIFVNFGAQAAPCTALVLLACANAAGTGPTFSGTTVNGSPVVSGVAASTQGINVGQAVSGNGIQAGTTVLAISVPFANGTVSVTLSENATVSGTEVLTLAPLPQPYELFACEAPNADTLGPITAQPATGYIPSGNSDIFYVIEKDASYLPAGYDYLQLEIVNGANANLASAHAILSGSRYGQDQSPTVLV